MTVRRRSAPCAPPLCCHAIVAQLWSSLNKDGDVALAWRSGCHGTIADKHCTSHRGVDSPHLPLPSLNKSPIYQGLHVLPMVMVNRQRSLRLCVPFFPLVDGVLARNSKDWMTCFNKHWDEQTLMATTNPDWIWEHSSEVTKQNMCIYKTWQNSSMGYGRIWQYLREPLFCCQSWRATTPRLAHGEGLKRTEWPSPPPPPQRKVSQQTFAAIHSFCWKFTSPEDFA